MSKLIIQSNSYIQNNLEKLFVNITVILFWVGQIFGSVDTFSTNEETNIVQQFYLNNLISDSFLTGFEITVVMLLCAIFIYKKNIIRKNNYRGFKFLILLTIVVLIISYINPNNLYKLGIFPIIFNRSARVFIIGILFMIVLFNMVENEYSKLISKMFNIGLIIISIRSIYLLISYFIGNGMIWINRKVTNSQGDFLQWCAIFNIILIAEYCIKRESYIYYYHYYYCL